MFNTAKDDYFGPLIVKPKEARRMLACSHTRLYELLAARELDSFLDGRSRKITVDSIRGYIARRLPNTESTKTVAKTRGAAQSRKARAASGAQ